MNQNSVGGDHRFNEDAPLSGRRAVVTGGARGLGAAIASALVDGGAAVVVWDAPEWTDCPAAYPLATAETLTTLIGSLSDRGATATGIGVDVRRPEQVQRAMRESIEVLGGVDLLVCAAGVRTSVLAATMTDQEWDAVVDANLHGTYHVLREAVRHLEDSGRGRAVVIAADEGRRGSYAHSHYAAAAWAQIGLAKSLALEVAESGTAVSVVCPGPLDTEMTTDPAYWAAVQAGRDGRAAVTTADREEAEHQLRVRHPSSRAYADQEAVVRAVLHLLAEPGLDLTGAVLDVSAGLAATNTA